MKTWSTIIFSIILLLAAVSVDISNSQTLSLQELDSAIWLIRQYGLASIPQSQSLCNFDSSFTCMDTGNGYHVVDIQVTASYQSLSAPDPSITALAFPELTSIYMSSNIDQVANQSINLLTILRDLPKLKTITFDNDITITSVPSDFPSNIPLLNEVNLYNGPLYSVPTFFNNSNVGRFSVWGKTIHNMTIDSTLRLPRFFHMDLDMDPNVPQTYTVTEVSFPALSYFSIASTGNVKLTININSTVCDQIHLDTVGQYGFNLNIQFPDKMAQLDVHGSDSVITPSNFDLYTSLTVLKIGQSLLTNYPFTVFPKYLTELSFLGSKFTTIPNLTLPSTLTSLDLSNNLLSGTVPWNIFSNVTSPFLLNVESNSLLTGDVPESFCIHHLKANNTGITSLPDCFMCYIGDPSIITTSIVPPSNYVCNITFTTTNLVTIFSVVTISGNNLGWGSSELTLITPNKLMQYNSSLPPVGPRSNIMISFNDNIPARRYPFTIIEAGISLTSQFTSKLGSGFNTIVLSIRANTFNPYLPHTFLINNTIPCTFVNLTMDGNATCETNTLLPSGTYTIQVSNQYYTTNTTIQLVFTVKDQCIIDTLSCYGNGNCDGLGHCICNSLSYYNNCSKTYPYTTSGDVGGQNQTQVTIYGDFGPNGQTSLSILINDTIPCAPVSNSQSTIVCALSQPPTSFGYASVNLTLDGLKYKSSAELLYFIPPPPTSNNTNTETPQQKCIRLTGNCYNHGQCNVLGQCDCDLGYNSDDFCLTKYINHTNEANTTAPTTSFNIDGVEFKFEIIAIQELDYNNRIAKEIFTNNWISKIVANGSETIVNYALNITDNVILQKNALVSATISFSNVSRTVPFGPQQLIIAPNAIKLSVNITNWKYSSNLNTLRVVFSTFIDPTQSIQVDCQDKSIDSFTNNELSNSIQYLRVVKGDIQFNGRFIDYAMADGRPTFSRTLLINQTRVNGDSSNVLATMGISLPQCSRCLIDPDFSPLLIANQDSGNEQCGEVSKESMTWKIIVGAAVGGGALISIVVATVLVVKMKRRKDRSNRSMQQKLSKF